MNAGYFIEQDLMYQTNAYSATVQPSDEKSTLQKEVEDNEDIDCLMKTDSSKTSHIDLSKDGSWRLCEA